jgi:hypothetical protein
MARQLEEHGKYQTVNLSQENHYQAAGKDTTLNVNTVASKRTAHDAGITSNDGFTASLYKEMEPG